MSSAVETLGSQLNGAKEYKKVGIVLWRCIMILSPMLPFIAASWLFAGDIFKAIGNSSHYSLFIDGILFSSIFLTRYYIFNL